MTQSLTQQVAERVKQELADTGRTQKQLAEHLNVSGPLISCRLSGKYAFPLSEMPAVAAFFGLSVADLLGGQAAAGVEQPVTQGMHPVSPAPDAVSREAEGCWTDPWTQSAATRSAS